MEKTIKVSMEASLLCFVLLTIASSTGSAEILHGSGLHSFTLSDSTRQKYYNTCPNPQKILRVAVAYDHQLCKEISRASKAGVEMFIRDRFAAVNYAFHSKTCVKIQVSRFFGSCSKKEGAFVRPKCDKKNDNCVIEEQVIRDLRERYYRMNTLSDEDVLFLISGVKNENGVAGYAFPKSICDDHLRFAWFDGTQSKSLLEKLIAHETGHLLGASHDKNGIMREKVHADAKIHISDLSAQQVSKFVGNDPGSVCLVDEQNRDSSIEMRQSWSRSSAEHKRSNVVDMAFANRPGGDKKDLFVLTTDFDVKKKKADLSYWVARDVTCKSSISCSYERRANRDRQPVLVPIAPYRNQLYSIATANLRTPAKLDIIVSSQSMINGPIWYIVGFSTAADDYTISKWSAQNELPRSEKAGIQFSAIATGSISDPFNIDLVCVYIRRVSGVNRAYYKIGYDLNELGVPQGKWSDAKPIPGSYENTGSLSVSVVQVTGRSSPELIIQYSFKRAASVSAFFRIGRDLNKIGQVTGGWSGIYPAPVRSVSNAAKREPKEFQTLSFIGGMSVEKGSGPFFTVVLAKKDFWGKSGYNAGDKPEWNFLFGNLYRESFKFDKPGEQIRLKLKDKCSDYPEDMKKKCKSLLNFCSTQRDDVRLASTSPKYSARMSMPRREEFPETSERLSKNLVMKTYFNGFKYMFDKLQDCDFFDRRTALKYGLLEDFARFVGRNSIFNTTVGETLDDRRVITPGAFVPGYQQRREVIVVSAKIPGWIKADRLARAWLRQNKISVLRVGKISASKNKKGVFQIIWEVEPNKWEAVFGDK